MKETLAIVGLLVLSGCAGVDDDQQPPSTMGGPSAEETVDCADHGFPQERTDLKIPRLPAETNGTIATDRGDIRIVLFAARSPITVCNFVQYALEDYYAGTVFHRICPHVIQAGGYTNPYSATTQKDGVHRMIKNEANVSQLRNYKFTLGMARDERPDSASVHFFINNRDNNYLDFDSNRTGVPPGYAVFGNVTGGQDVAVAIAQSPTTPEPDDVTSQTGQFPNSCGNTPRPDSITTISRIRIDA